MPASLRHNPPKVPESCHVLATPSKGYGVFTLHSITPGTILLHDKPILRLDRGSNDITLSQLTSALFQLSKEENATFLYLHENNLPYNSRQMRIYKSNCFGDSATSWLCLKFSRVNHSCAPNAEITDIDAPEGAKIVAIKPIGKGEEVTICYLGPGEDGRGEVRRELLRGTYGFECDCEACGLSGVEGWLSDVRRGCVAVLAGRQMGVEISELGGLNGVAAASGGDVAPLGYSHRPIVTPLTPKEKVQTNVLLALCLEAEGLVNYRLARAWVHAAVALMAQMQALKPVVVLPAAKLLETWLGRAMQIMRCVRTEESREVKELRSAVGVLTGCSYVVAAGKVVKEVKKGRKRGGKNGEVKKAGAGKGKKARKNVEWKRNGAVEGEEVCATVFGETNRRLTQKECLRYVRMMKGRKNQNLDVVIEGCDG